MATQTTSWLKLRTQTRRRGSSKSATATQEKLIVAPATPRPFIKLILTDTILDVYIRVRCHRLIDQMVNQLGFHLEHELTHDDVTQAAVRDDLFEILAFGPEVSQQVGTFLVAADRDRLVAARPIGGWPRFRNDAWSKCHGHV